MGLTALAAAATNAPFERFPDILQPPGRSARGAVDVWHGSLARSWCRTLLDSPERGGADMIVERELLVERCLLVLVVGARIQPRGSRVGAVRQHLEAMGRQKAVLRRGSGVRECE